MVKKLLLASAIAALGNAQADQSPKDTLTRYILRLAIEAEKHEKAPARNYLYDFIKAFDIRAPRVNEIKKINSMNVNLGSNGEFFKFNSETFKYRQEYIIKSVIAFKDKDAAQLADNALTIKKKHIKTTQEELWYTLQDAFTNCVEKRTINDHQKRSFECYTRIPMQSLEKLYPEIKKQNE